MTELRFSRINGRSLVPNDDVMVNIKRYVDQSDSDRSSWNSKQDKYNRLRMRVKKTKTFPFKNSSNIRMPTAETNIRKIKSGIMGQVFGIRPVVNAIPSPSGNIETAGKIEKLLDHLIMDVIKLKKKAEYGVDQSLEKGFYLANPYWKLEIIDRKEEIDLREMRVEEVISLFTLPKEIILQDVIQRFDVDMDDNVAEDNLLAIEDALEKIFQGKDKVKIYFRDVIYNFPDVDFISPERCYVPSDSGFDPQDCTNITLEKFIPLHQVKSNVQDKGWDVESVNKIIEFVGTDLDKKQSDYRKDIREGISMLNNPSQLVKVWETFGWFDIDGDGKLEKAVITSLPDFDQVVRKVLMDSYSGRYNIVKLYYELIDNRWYSHRGIPELLEDIIKEIDVQHNMKIDSQTMRNAPMIVYRAGMINPRLIGVNPGAGIPVNGLQPLNDTISAINLHNPNAEFSYEREQQLLELKVQEMLGQVDYGLQSIVNKRQPRTLGEVEAQQSSAARVFNLDSSHYIDAFSEIFQIIFELWSQYGPDEYEFLYFGELAQGERIKLTKEEIQGKYTINVRGNDQNTNPDIKIQKAQQVLAAVTNPLLLQLGIVGPQNVANGVKRFFQELDIERWEDFINAQPQPQQEDPRRDIPMRFSDLTDSEKAQVLQAKGVVPDAPGRESNQIVERIKDAAEVANKVG